MSLVYFAAVIIRFNETMRATLVYILNYDIMGGVPQGGSGDVSYCDTQKDQSYILAIPLYGKSIFPPQPFHTHNFERKF